MTAWDEYSSHVSPCCEYSVSGAAIHCCRLHDAGVLCGVGDSDGNLTILQLCGDLVIKQRDEVDYMSSKLLSESTRQQNNNDRIDKVLSTHQGM